MKKTYLLIMGLIAINASAQSMTVRGESSIFIKKGSEVKLVCDTQVQTECYRLIIEPISQEPFLSENSDVTIHINDSNIKELKYTGKLINTKESEKCNWDTVTILLKN
ncbi:hypothetical protein [Myroides sp. DW712]|uniref:hypothetical protein n=1 Tax=Myroides sp. DW712 TaxID=3389800 RepID=UPI00397D1E4E